MEQTCVFGPDPGEEADVEEEPGVHTLTFHWIHPDCFVGQRWYGPSHNCSDVTSSACYDSLGLTLSVSDIS